MKKSLKPDLWLLAILLILGQIIFLFVSPRFTEVSYINRIYATTGVKHKQEDLHKLNEAAHYFGQTIIGWLKFPNFLNNLNLFLQDKSVPNLPVGSALAAQMQERQNIIFVLTSSTPLIQEQVQAAKDFIQSRIDEYNRSSQTEFVLTNLDYEVLTVKKTYAFGAIVTLFVSLVVALAIAFIRREFRG